MVRWKASYEKGYGEGGSARHDKRAVRLPVHGLLQFQQNFPMDGCGRHASVRNKQTELHTRLEILHLIWKV